jgi:hypothetical protein
MSERMPQNRTESDVARLVAEIDLQYQAAQMALSGVALGTSIHAFITARMERIEDARQELVELVGDENEANKLVIEQMNKSADNKGEN